MDNLEKILKIQKELKYYSSLIYNRKKEFKKIQAEQKEQFQKMQDESRLQFNHDQEEIINLKDNLLNQEEELLNSIFYIKLGDLKNELINYFQIEEKDIRIKVNPLDMLHGEYSTEKRISDIKRNTNYKRIVSVEISIKKLNIYYSMNYNMNYNMEQSDGISFIDHCYSKNEWDILDDMGIVNMLYVDSNSCDDILVKIPYKSLIFEAKKDFIGAVPGINKREYYWNTPLNAFTTCIANCVNKDSKVNSPNNKYVLKKNKELINHIK